MHHVLRGLRQSTVLGLLCSACLLVTMILTVPSHILDFINISGLVVVFGGTLAATLVCRPFADVKRTFGALPAALSDELPSITTEIQQLLAIADHYRHGYLRAAEEELARVRNPFLHSGLQLILDRSSLPDLMKVLQWRLEGARNAESVDANIMRTMASFAPAFGMLGTLFGLVHMLHELGNSDMKEIGSAMAFALMSTLYGIVAANLFCKPFAMKMERRAQQKLAQLAVLQEGILMVHERQHPLLIKETLAAFLSQQLQTADRASHKKPLLKAA
jgi:chemotaxis protein MotA